MTHEELVELHSKYFNSEKVAIKDLDDAAKNERRELLRMIAFEAKAKLSAHDEDEREQNAKNAKDRKDWLLSSSFNDPSITEAVTAVKGRKKRMSEADKLHAKLSSIGVSGPELDQIVAQAVKNNTGAAVSSSTSRVLQDKRVSPVSENCKRNLHKGCSGTKEDEKPCECKCHKPKVIFDPNAVNFKKKD